MFSQAIIQKIQVWRAWRLCSVSSTYPSVMVGIARLKHFEASSWIYGFRAVCCASINFGRPCKRNNLCSHNNAEELNRSKQSSITHKLFPGSCYGPFLFVLACGTRAKSLFQLNLVYYARFFIKKYERFCPESYVM